MITVIKRDGSSVDFDKTKIIDAIMKACGEVEAGDGITYQQAEEIANRISNQRRSRLLVEQIQDQVENAILRLGKYTLAKQYITYRYQRALVRKANTTDDGILTLLDETNQTLIDENSNKNAHIASTQRDLIAGEVSKDLSMRLLLPKKIVDAHNEGLIHFHDADYFIQRIHNCCLINIKDMLDNGTMMNGKLIESPKGFQVACTVTTQIIAAVASNQYGLK